MSTLLAVYSVHYKCWISMLNLLPGLQFKECEGLCPSNAGKGNRKINQFSVLFYVDENIFRINFLLMIYLFSNDIFFFP